MERDLVKSIIQFIRVKGSDGSMSEDKHGTLEVAAECLEHAFGISSDESSEYRLEDMFSLMHVSEERKTEGEICKETGNEHMRAGREREAVECYTQAISKNPLCTYFSNRSAAYLKMGLYDESLADAERAVQLSPQYAQAYGRLGSVCLATKRYPQAVKAFEKAVELDDTKTTFKDNLQLARKEMAGGDNTDIMRIASQLMTDSNMQSMVGDLLSGQGTPDIAALMQMGQQFAEQLRTSNPDVVEQLQNAFRPPGNPPDTPPS